MLMLIKLQLAEIISKAIKHVRILGIARGERFDKANQPERECKDEGTNGQDKATHQP